MKPTKTLPENYNLGWAVDMKKDTRLNWALQVAGMLWFVLAGGLLWRFIIILRPADIGPAQFPLSFSFLAGILIVIFVTLSLHELVHGLFFWLFTHEKPEFGIGPGYAFAAAPGWYFPRGRYFIVALAPFVLLTAVGLLLLALVPAAWLGLLFFAIVFNAGGAVGDLYISMRIWREAPDIWIRDRGDGFEIYRRRVD